MKLPVGTERVELSIPQDPGLWDRGGINHEGNREDDREHSVDDSVWPCHGLDRGSGVMQCVGETEVIKFAIAGSLKVTWDKRVSDK
jgi:hypothetical protein